MAQYDATVMNWKSIKWPCHYCIYDFNDYKNLKCHLRETHNIANVAESDYQCYYCKTRFLGYILFVNHVRNVHYEKLRLCCDVCNELLKDFVQLSVHRDHHNEILSNEYPVLYHCTLCENACSTKKELKTHVRLKHVSIYREETYNELRQHSNGEIEDISQSSSSTHRLEIDEASTQSKDEFNEDEHSLQCKICLQSFAKESDLNIHLKMHCGKASFKCKLCPQLFSDKSTLMQHVRLHSSSGKTSLQCKICFKFFSTKSSLKAHKELHTDMCDDGEERPFSCSGCSKSYKTISLLKRHILHAHTNQRPFRCDFCEKRFKTSSDRKCHIRSIHTEERPFKCDFCPKSFKNKTHLKVHLRVHSDERPFQCQNCGKRFKSKQIKVLHSRIHLNKRPFACDYCDKTFITKQGKEEHKVLHFDERPFDCQTCSKKFKRMWYLKKHAKVCKGSKETANQ